MAELNWILGGYLTQYVSESYGMDMCQSSLFSLPSVLWIQLYARLRNNLFSHRSITLQPLFLPPLRQPFL